MNESVNATEAARSAATARAIEASLSARFGEEFRVDPAMQGLDELARIAGHCVHRRFLRRPVEPVLVRLLCACALSAPSKSDLQQADILVLRDSRRRAARRPYGRQRAPEKWGNASFYGWSEDKARQYAEPLRADFGAFVRTCGFHLD